MRLIGKNVLILSGAFCLSFILRWIAFNQTPYANGWDAYFYLIQVKSLHETGAMHSPEWTLIYPLIYFVFNLSSNGVFSIKFISTLLAASTVFPVFLIAKYKGGTPLALLAISLVTFSPELTYFAAQWPKNLLGMILYFWLIYALVKGNWKAIIMLLIMGFFGHRMTAILGVFTALLWYVSIKISWKYHSMIAAAVILAIVIIQFIPGLLTIHDLERFNGLFQANFQLTPLSFLEMFDAQKVSVLWIIELSLTTLLMLGAIIHTFIKSVQKKPIDPLVLILICVSILLWFPFYQITMDGIPYRLFHAGALLLSLLCIVTYPNNRVNQYLTIGVVILFIGLSLNSWKAYNPKTQDPPYLLYQEISEKILKEFQMAEVPDVIIAHKSLAEMITYTIDVDVMPWIPEYSIPKNQLYRIAYLPFPKLFSFYTTIKPLALRSNYYYVKETDWQLFIEKIEENEPDQLLNLHTDWKNPSQVRPAYLTRNR